MTNTKDATAATEPRTLCMFHIKTLSMRARLDFLCKRATWQGINLEFTMVKTPPKTHYDTFPTCLRSTDTAKHILASPHTRLSHFSMRLGEQDFNTLYICELREFTNLATNY